jgi:hypothetical protein
MPKFKPYPDESPIEALERISENIENEGLPTANAMDRSESYQLGGGVRPPTAPSMPQYKKGGKVDVTDIVKEVEANKKIDKEIAFGMHRGRMYNVNGKTEWRPRKTFDDEQRKTEKKTSKMKKRILK